jgi:hypothetical protein
VHYLLFFLGSSGKLNVPVFQKWDVKDEIKGTPEIIKLEYNENNNWDVFHA